MSERAVFERFLDVLDRMISRVESIQSHRAGKDFGTGIPLYRAEIHTMKTIGDTPGINVTRLAEHMGVTKGAVSQTLGKLVRKKLVRKTNPPDNAKEVILELTDLGWTGYHNHEQFHMEMFNAVHEYYGDTLVPRLQNLITAIEDLNCIIDTYEDQVQGG